MAFHPSVASQSRGASSTVNERPLLADSCRSLTVKNQDSRTAGLGKADVRPCSLSRRPAGGEGEGCLNDHYRVKSQGSGSIFLG